MFREKKKYCIWKQAGEFSFLENLFLQYPDNKDWNHAFLAMNPNISLDFIEKYIDKEEIKYTAINPNITRDFMEKHPEVFSVKGGLDFNIALTLDDYLFIGGKTEYTGKNKNIDIFYKILTREKYNLEKPNIFWEIIIDNVTEKWDWDILSSHPLLDWDSVKNIKKLKWSRLSKNRNITWEIVRDNPDKPWDWEALSQNPNITWEIVRDNGDKPWDWLLLSANPNITWDILQEDLYKNLEYRNIDSDSDSGYDSDFGFGDHKKVPEKLDNIYRGKWEFYGLTINPNITIDIIESNPDLPWRLGCLGSLSQNPNLNLYAMDIHEIDFGDISRNEFIYNDTVYKSEKKKDIKFRQIHLKLIFEKLSPFSRNIDKVIFKKLNYN
jgi:hypothetical protein